MLRNSTRELDFDLGETADAIRGTVRDFAQEQIAPRADEIVVAVAVTDSGRPLPRVGGLTKDEIKGEDGLR